MNHTNFSPYSSSPETKLERYSPTHSQTDIMPAAQISTAPASAAAPAAPGKPKTKPRKRVNTAEKRHQHNAVERQRRETLNSKFFVLARLLPCLAKTARPSKSAIVKGSIAHLTKQRDQRLLASRLLRQLCAERDELARECNGWRAASGYAGGQEPAAASAWTEEMDEVCMVEQETFGEFAEEGEDADDNEDQEEAVETGGQAAAVSVPMGIEQATAAVASFTSTAMGLITPRSSTEIDPLSLALGLSIPTPDQSRPSTQLTQSRDINWPTNFDFSATVVPGLSAAESIPLAQAQHSLHRSSSASIPFGAFMSDTSSASPTASLLNGLPTPPTASDFSHFTTHTPSPRSSGAGSFDEKSHHSQQQFSNQALPAFASQPRSQWTQADQLLFLHSLQQQQLQQSQFAEIQHRSTPAGAFGRSHSASSDTFAQLQHPSQNMHSAAQSLPIYSASTLQQLQMQQQQQSMMLQQQQQQQMGGGQGQGQGMAVPRMSNEQMEAWKKLAMGNANGSGSGGARAEFGMWAQNALKGY